MHDGWIFLQCTGSAAREEFQPVDSRRQQFRGRIRGLQNLEISRDHGNRSVALGAPDIKFGI